MSREDPPPCECPTTPSQHLRLGQEQQDVLHYGHPSQGDVSERGQTGRGGGGAEDPRGDSRGGVLKLYASWRGMGWVGREGVDGSVADRTGVVRVRGPVVRARRACTGH